MYTIARSIQLGTGSSIILYLGKLVSKKVYSTDVKRIKPSSTLETLVRSKKAKDISIKKNRVCNTVLLINVYRSESLRKGRNGYIYFRNELAEGTAEKLNIRGWGK